MNDILSRNLSRESILQTKYMAFNKFASWCIWTYNILTTRKKSYPSDCNPPMNSCFENSHIVAAFMCHETTNWNNNKNLCYQNSAKPSSHLLDNSSRHRTFINCSFYRLQLKILESEFESGINEYFFSWKFHKKKECMSCKADNSEDIHTITISWGSTCKKVRIKCQANCEKEMISATIHTIWKDTKKY